jgi:hypothetical protein
MQKKKKNCLTRKKFAHEVTLFELKSIKLTLFGLKSIELVVFEKTSSRKIRNNFVQT